MEANYYDGHDASASLVVGDAMHLRKQQAENARLKKLVANQALDIDMLKEIASGNF